MYSDLQPAEIITCFMLQAVSSEKSRARANQAAFLHLIEKHFTRCFSISPGSMAGSEFILSYANKLSCVVCLQKMTLSEVRTLLRERNINPGGSKGALIERYFDAVKSGDCKPKMVRHLNFALVIQKYAIDYCVQYSRKGS